MEILSKKEAWLTTSLLLLIAGTFCVGQEQTKLAQNKYPFQDPALPVEARISNILSLMTLEEKVAALGTNPSVPRLGILGSGHVEGLHGLALGGPGGWGRYRDANGKSLDVPVPTTQFPQEVGLGETWDPDIVRQAAEIEGFEARYVFQSDAYHRGGLVIRAPNADLDRDPRWGRSEESYGEDPYLDGTMVTAFVKGLQGDDPKYWQTAALLKHFMANSNENGRDGSSSDFDERLMREYYSVPFRMGIVEGGARAYMTAYNAWNGIPMATHPILKDMTFKDWGFDGIICTDAGALTNMVTRHKYYKSLDQAVAGAIHAGVNQFLDSYREPVENALKNKMVSEAQIDEDLRGVYRVMIRLGFLDPPAMVPYASIQGTQDPWKTEKHKAVARRVTQESIVLLKNEDHFLPLKRDALKSIAVIGPHANEVLLDWYSGTPPYVVTPLEGIKNKMGAGVNVLYAANNEGGAAVKIAKSSDIAIVIIGNHPTCGAGWNQCPTPSDGKEAIDRKSIVLEQEDLAKQVYAANPHTVVVLLSSFPFAINWTKNNVPAILHMAHNSEEEGNALADVLFGDYNPGGRLVDTWPQSIEQLPPMMDYDIRHGRTYMYFQGEPLYPFGFGLSYTTFSYSNLRTSADNLSRESFITVSVDVRNSGVLAGDEVVQLYVKHLDSKVERPFEELKGFKRIAIQPGQTKTVEFPLKAADLSYWDVANHRFVVEHEKTKVMVGSSSADARLSKTLSIAP
jgi:beta-glucosidase